jgi:hypothetical protein
MREVGARVKGAAGGRRRAAAPEKAGELRCSFGGDFDFEGRDERITDGKGL